MLDRRSPDVRMVCKRRTLPGPDLFPPAKSLILHDAELRCLVLAGPGGALLTHAWVINVHP